jgi:hypothetical protein
MSIITCRKPNQDSVDITTAPRSVNLLPSAADVAVMPVIDRVTFTDAASTAHVIK